MTPNSAAPDSTRTDSPEVEALSRGLPERRYRPELHGVRGLAILGVVLFHLFGAGRISGGIDIFLAISGFLFTAMLLREASTKGGVLNLVRYLARLGRRLLPPAILVIATTILAGLWLLPSTSHHQLLREARASFLYFENVELVRSQLGYGAAGPETSPFQHFWSLSVQGQFYLVWPLVAILAVLIARRIGKPAVTVMAGLVGLILLGSFVFALYMQGVSQDEAYLMTRTRFWELAFGGLLALLGARLTLPAALRLPAGWAGFALIVLCGLVLDGAQLFPGPWALWPLLGLALVLAAAGPEGGDKDAPGTATRLLSNRPFAFIGNIAYSLYLWHWPLLIFYLEVRGYPEVGLRGAAFVFALSLTLAWLTYQWVERPSSALQMFSDRWVAIAVITILTIGGTGLTAAAQEGEPDIPDGYAMSGVDRSEFPGAATVNPGVPHEPEDAEFLPEVDVLSEVRPSYYEWGCRQDLGDAPGAGEVLLCEDPNAPTDPAVTIMLAGGSHAGQWHHAWQLLGEQNNWEIIIADKSGCIFTDSTNPEEDKCHEWNENFEEFVAEQDPDVVFTPGTRIPQGEGSEYIEEGAADRWEEITATGAELLLMRGTPRQQENVAECLAGGEDPDECGPDFGKYDSENPLDSADLPQGTSTLDMTDYICPGQECPAVIGNIAVYYDSHHLSNYYVETLAPVLDEKLRDEMPHLYE